MKRYLIIAGLLFGLAGLMANAQATPSTDQSQPQTGAQQSTPPTFPSDQQGSSTSQSPASQSPSSTMPSDQTSSSPTSSQSGQTGSSSTSQEPSGSSTAGGMSAGGGDEQSKIQSALQQQGLSNVQASVSGDSIELSGTVASKDEKKAAKKIAEENANGKKVNDSGLTVAEKTGTQPQ